MKIDKHDVAKLRNDAHFQFNTEFEDLVNKTGAETLNIQSQFSEYAPLLRREDTALKKIVKSALTKNIHDTDKRRDDAWHGLVEINTTVLKRHSDPAVRESARKLKIVFDTYGNIAKKPLNEQTSAIHNVMQDLTGSYSADVTRVGLTAWVSELQNTNSELDNLVKERFDETAAKSDIVLREARVEVDTAYHTIVERINALIVIEGVANYEVFVKTLNAIIAKYRVHVHRHHGTASGGTTPPPQTDSEDDTDENDVQT